MGHKCWYKWPVLWLLWGGPLHPLNVLHVVAIKCCFILGIISLNGWETTGERDIFSILTSSFSTENAHQRSPANTNRNRKSLFLIWNFSSILRLNSIKAINSGPADCAVQQFCSSAWMRDSTVTTNSVDSNFISREHYDEAQFCQKWGVTNVR